MSYENNFAEAKKGLKKAENAILTAIGVLVMGKAVENLRKPRPHRGGGSFPTYDTGNLANSITYEVTSNGVQIGTPLEYAEYIEKGVKAHWTSPNHLKDWCRRKLGDENAAYAIVQSIAREDGPPMPFLEPAFTENVAQIQQIAGKEVSIVFPD